MSILFFKQGKIVLVTKVWKMEFAQNSYVSIMNLAVVKEIVLLTTRHVYVMKASVALTVQLISKVKNYALIWNYIHPWAGEDLGLKIDDRDQTIWICILEL